MTNEQNTGSFFELLKVLLVTISWVVIGIVGISFSGAIVTGILVIILANPLLAIIALCVFGIFAHITEGKK